MKIRCMVRGVVGLVWAILAVDAIPGVEVVPTDQLRMLLLSVAITGSLAFVVCYVQRSSDEVFNEGREHERRIMLREMNECKVLPFNRTGA